MASRTHRKAVVINNTINRTAIFYCTTSRCRCNKCRDITELETINLVNNPTCTVGLIDLKAYKRRTFEICNNWECLCFLSYIDTNGNKYTPKSKKEFHNVINNVDKDICCDNLEIRFEFQTICTKAVNTAISLNIPSNLISQNCNMKRTRHCVLIGVDKYDDNSIKDLSGCSNDVILLKEAYERDSAQFNNNIIMLSKGNVVPTRNNIIKEIYNMCKEADINDVVVIHFSCHGTAINGQLFLHPQDTSAESDMMEDTSIKFSSILHRLDQSCNAVQRFITIDACESGSLRGSVISTREAAIRDIKKADKRFITACFSACSYNEKAQEVNKCGIFTSLLARGLNDKKACNDKGFIDPNSLFTYIKNEIRCNNVNQCPNYKYHGNTTYDPSIFAISYLNKIQEDEIKVILISNDKVIYNIFKALHNNLNTKVEQLQNVNVDALMMNDVNVVLIDIRDDGTWENAKYLIDEIWERCPRISCMFIGPKRSFLESLPTEDYNTYNDRHFINLDLSYLEVIHEFKLALTLLMSNSSYQKNKHSEYKVYSTVVFGSPESTRTCIL